MLFLSREKLLAGFDGVEVDRLLRSTTSAPAISIVSYGLIDSGKYMPLLKFEKELAKKLNFWLAVSQ